MIFPNILVEPPSPQHPPQQKKKKKKKKIKPITTLYFKKKKTISNPVNVETLSYNRIQKEEIGGYSQQHLLNKRVLQYITPY